MINGVQRSPSTSTPQAIGQYSRRLVMGPSSTDPCRSGSTDCVPPLTLLPAPTGCRLLVVRSFSDGLEVIAGGTTLPLVSQHLSTASSLLTATTSVANRQESSSGDVFMIAESSGTETVVRNHLHAFLGKQGIDSIVQDYHESALFYSEAKIYRGKQEIHGFFADFIDSLPAGGIDRFQLRSLHV